MIYLDNAATTRPSSSALKQAEIFNQSQFFNPSALYHGGLKCSKEIKNAKETILKSLSALNFDLTFTSCGTESDNLAIFGVVKRGTFVTDLGEHSAVYKSFVELKNKGLNVQFISLNVDGSVNVSELLDYVKNNKVNFMSISHVNNETGAINDINTIAKEIKKIDKSIIFHSDGVQAFGKIPYRISNDIDLYSISAHKINALKGTGALIHKKGLNLTPIIIGGGQENGIRSGTENVFGIKVFEYATKEHYISLKENYQKVSELKDYCINNLDKDIFKIISSENSSPYVLSVSAVGLRGEVLMHALEQKEIIVGNGSACSSKNRFSRVIKACGYSDAVADGMVRISFSTENTLDEIVVAVNEINSTAKKLKGIIK